MPLRLGGRFRKRWRWVGAFGERLIVFGAIVEIGPAPMTFWGIWDRERRRLRERTRRMLPGARLEVGMPGRSMRIRSGQVEVDLELGEGKPIECMCPNGEGGYTWTRKLAAVPVTGEVRMGGRGEQLEALGGRGRLGRISPPPHRLEVVGGGRSRSSTGGQSAGTWSTGSTTRRRPASERSGSTGSPASRGR